MKQLHGVLYKGRSALIGTPGVVPLCLAPWYFVTTVVLHCPTCATVSMGLLCDWKGMCVIIACHVRADTCKSVYTGGPRDQDLCGSAPRFQNTYRVGETHLVVSIRTSDASCSGSTEDTPLLLMCCLANLVQPGSACNTQHGRYAESQNP
jgi:hypothetical protein